MDITRAKELAKYYMEKHGILKIDGFWESGWKFEFCRSKTIFGHCDLKDKVIRLSKHLTELQSEEEVVDTILHEIAHAVCPPIRVMKLKRMQWDVHHKAWQQYFLSIGGNGKRCGTIKAEDRSKIEYKYTYSCGVCGSSFGVHRLSTKKKAGTIKSSCSKCHPNKFNKDFILTITQNF